MIRRLWWWLFTAPHCCGNCRYWRGSGQGDSYELGTCRAELPRVVTYSAPPAVVAGGRSASQSPARLGVESYWPPVAEPEWCSRFRRRWDAR